MTITSAFATSFKRELLEMTPHTAADTYKLLLIKTGHTGTYNAATTNVGTPGTGTPSSSNVGTDAVAASGGYASVDGITLAGLAVSVDGTTAVATFTDPAALSATTISADGCVIYNATRGGRVLGVFAFADAPRVSSGGSFDINLPAATAAAGLIRI